MDFASTPITYIALDAALSCVRAGVLSHHQPAVSFLQVHAKKVEAVFEAARGGQYRHTGGVDVLLRAYSLPGTLHDHQGRSLLHYAASVQLADGAPLWLAQDVRSLVESHGVLLNAVDFKGVCVCVRVMVTRSYLVVAVTGVNDR